MADAITLQQVAAIVAQADSLRFSFHTLGDHTQIQRMRHGAVRLA